MTLSEKPTGSGQSESQPPGLLLILRLPPLSSVHQQSVGV